MDMQQLLAEVEHLDEDALVQLKQQIAQRENELRRQHHPRTELEWGQVLTQFLDDFWADTPAEEQTHIVEAIRTKNIPPDRDV